MRAHAEAVRDRLKILLLLVGRMPRAPPPRLMHKWPVRRIHQSDNSVIDRTRQISGEIRQLVSFAEFRNLRRRNRSRRSLREPSSHGSGIRNKYPDKIIALFARITAGINAINF